MDGFFRSFCKAILLASLIVMVTACTPTDSANSDSANKAEERAEDKAVKLTYGETISHDIKASKISYIAFYVEPKGKYTCQAIKASAAKWNGFHNYWEPHASQKIVFNLNNPSKRVPLKDQLILIPVQSPGKYSIFDLTCTPMKGRDIVFPEIAGEFTVKAEAINYIGELSQHVSAPTIHLYLTKNERHEAAKTHLETLDVGLSEYQNLADFTEGEFHNYNGKILSFSQLAENKNRSEDYFVLSQGLAQEAVLWEETYIKETARPHPIYAHMLQAYYFKKKDQALERVYTLWNLVKSTDNYEVINNYMQSRLTYDDLVVPKFKPFDINTHHVQRTTAPLRRTLRENMAMLEGKYNLNPHGSKAQIKEREDYYDARERFLEAQKVFFKNITGGSRDVPFIKLRGLSSVEPYLDSLDEIERLSDMRIERFVPMDEELKVLYVAQQKVFFDLRRDYFIYALENVGSTDSGIKNQVNEKRRMLTEQRELLELLRE
ncbi:MAG: hypothetical protein ABJ275_08360 [Maricaulaceae bacterium]